MEYFLDFVRAKRPTLLILGGLSLAGIWLWFMNVYNLFTIKPFGSETATSMSVALWIFVPLSVIILLLLYFVSGLDTEYSPAAESLYRLFKNYMVVLVIITIVIGTPRIKYYQMRAENIYEESSEHLTYYQQRTIARVIKDLFRIVDATSEHSEEIVTDVAVIPILPSADLDTSNSTPTTSTSSSDDWLDNIWKSLAPAIVIVVIVMVVIYFFALAVMAIIYQNFWLVTLLCLAFGMITLGFIDIHDGPRK